MKIVRVFFIFILIFTALMPGTEIESGDYEHKIIHYVALGDSIAKGYGLEDVDRESYVGRIAQALEEQYGAVRLTNFGKNGLRSEQLLEILTDEDHEQHKKYMEEIERADLITLSIGSNDLLQYLSVDMDLEEFEAHGDEIFTKACERFWQNIPQIIDVIHSHAPQAQLFVNNIYNPCNDVSFDLSAQLDAMAEKYIVKMNEGFVSREVQSVFHPQNGGGRPGENQQPENRVQPEEGQQPGNRVQSQDGQKSEEGQQSDKSERTAENGGYELVDVKQAFEQADEKLINMVVSWGEIDPHPNREGHKKIADEIIPRLSVGKSP